MTREPRSILLAVARPLFTVAVLVLVYYLAPVDRSLSIRTLLVLVLGLCLVGVTVAWEVRTILRSPYPTLQGVQALALVIPMFLLLFANFYYLLELNRAGSFTTPLTRTDALYFVVTVFATVGLGDIAPVTQGARILVTCQMIGDLLVLGVVLRVILMAVQHRQRQPAPIGSVRARARRGRRAGR